ncbi:hypothetical protein D9758_002668 [Tetrapyrgos nigripes]|uniref:Uncharacterized protein n=1 Tax=Tetrapyrgos nigripes TaxID=182062 RepID=A0A8H5GQG3_9AGAR|nr:hypothetical protein D9758_002668 [Tetrapyrgos nigripes]
MDPVTNYHSRTARKAAKSFSRPRKLSLQTSKASASITAATPVARDDAYGSFTPTTPVFSSLRHIASSRPRTSLFVPFTRKRHTSMFEWPDSDGSSPPSSPMLSQAPSICRTISYDGTEVYSPASSSTTTLPDIKQPATTHSKKSQNYAPNESIVLHVEKLGQIFQDVGDVVKCGVPELADCVTGKDINVMH